LGAFEKRILKRKCGPLTEEDTRQNWVTNCVARMLDIHSTHSTGANSKSVSPTYAAPMGEKITMSMKFQPEKPDGDSHQEDLDVDGRRLTKSIQ